MHATSDNKLRPKRTRKVLGKGIVLGSLTICASVAVRAAAAADQVNQRYPAPAEAPTHRQQQALLGWRSTQT